MQGTRPAGGAARFPIHYSFNHPQLADLMKKLNCFKAYDIRGQLGSELDDDIAYRIGRAYAAYLKPASVAVGADVRLTSEALKRALARGLTDSGIDVVDLGMTGTEEVYFAASAMSSLNVDGGIEITASHNPMDYNGMKLVGKHALPISGDSGLRAIQTLAEENAFPPVAASRGTVTKKSVVPEYVDHLLGYIDVAALKPLKLVVNAGNGAAGHVVDSLEKRFACMGATIDFIKIQHEPDGNFPHGIPNPLLPECRQATAHAVMEHKADMGIAWDGDFDRCFLFDERGAFIEGYYIVGLLAEAFLRRSPGEKIIHDPRLIWNTQSIVTEAAGIPVMSKTGHAFIKERMRQENAIYGGEMSAHHYFRDFAYCDSGMIPWLLIAELLSTRNIPLSAMVSERVAAFPSSGEINRRIANASAVVEQLPGAYERDAVGVDRTDGVSVDMHSWRFNLRLSNTEPLVRLNVESRSNRQLMEEKTAEVLALLDSLALHD